MDSTFGHIAEQCKGNEEFVLSSGTWSRSCWFVGIEAKRKTQSKCGGNRQIWRFGRCQSKRPGRDRAGRDVWYVADELSPENLGITNNSQNNLSPGMKEKTNIMATWLQRHDGKTISQPKSEILGWWYGMGRVGSFVEIKCREEETEHAARIAKERRTHSIFHS